MLCKNSEYLRERSNATIPPFHSTHKYEHTLWNTSVFIQQHISEIKPKLIYTSRCLCCKLLSVNSYRIISWLVTVWQIMLANLTLAICLVFWHKHRIPKHLSKIRICSNLIWQRVSKDRHCIHSYRINSCQHPFITLGIEWVLTFDKHSAWKRNELNFWLTSVSYER